jgi:restriction system protein
MSLWIVRGGKYGEYESKFIEENKVFLTWGDLTANDLTTITDYNGVRDSVAKLHPDETNRTVGNWSGQIWAFLLAIKVDDWIVLPRKKNRTIAIGKVISKCKFDSTAENDYKHYRDIEWLNIEIPRINFDQDILFSFGAVQTVCEVKRNDAETRVRAMHKNNWHVSNIQTTKVKVSTTNAEAVQDEIAVDQVEVDLEELARDAIANLIIQKFKGHGMARLVNAILRAQGFTTYLSPEGPDKGVDILAGSGAFGFENPKICVQVKSGDTPADHTEFTHLIGAMQSVQADYGLFVSWSDFKQTVNKEEANKFFKVRLWNQSDLIEQLLANYDKLDQSIQSEIPLKRIWLVANQDI